jgi:FAD/FMN-containing dehydrogenase
MRGATIDVATRRARVESGAWWEDVVPQASGLGLAMLHGSSPNVGVTGYSLGGGIGWMARRYGLATNSVTAIELVTADGELVRADAHHEPDLFWALRGGGGNFGVVTALEFALYPVQSFHAGWLIWPWERSAEVLHRWSEWVQTVPDEVTSVGRILQLPPLEMIPEPLRGRQIVVVEAAYLGSEEGGAALLEPLRELRPEMDTFAQVPPVGLAHLHQDPEPPTPAIVDHALLDEFGPDAVEAFVATAGPGSGSPIISAEVRHLGGALGVPAAGGGALSHVDASFMMATVGIPTDPEVGEAIEQQARKVLRALAPFDAGRTYLNFAERPTDMRSAFTADAYKRLRAVKDEVDPDDLFRSNHQLNRTV